MHTLRRVCAASNDMIYIKTEVHTHTKTCKAQLHWPPMHEMLHHSSPQ